MTSFAWAVLLALATTLPVVSTWPASPKVYKYVLSFSVDGLHSSDVDKYAALRPHSTIASLLATGYEYTDAYTSAVRHLWPLCWILFALCDCH